MRKAGEARPRIRLVHRGSESAEAGRRLLLAAGYRVDGAAFDGPAALRRLREDPPAALVIDLDRSPAYGRDVGIAVRHAKATRHLPLVFAGGAPEKVEAVHRLLPDAAFTSWRAVRGAVKRALARPARQPVVPESLLAGYSGRPLARKLGIKADAVVALIQAPPGFEKTLGRLPAGVRLQRHARGPCDRIVWFTKSRRDLERRVRTVAARLAEKGGLWIAWPKKTSRLSANLTQGEVRRIGLAAGLVDYKICAIDETWSGLLFARRAAHRPRSRP